MNESRAYPSVRSATAPCGRLSQEPFQIIDPFCRPAFATKHPLPAAWQIEWAKAALLRPQGVERA
ncbi:MAG TPA: hypothetical protein VLY86_03495 [Methanothrix sp.]|nr:hypothetical protein [Methanothrix sp.]